MVYIPSYQNYQGQGSQQGSSSSRRKTSAYTPSYSTYSERNAAQQTDNQAQNRITTSQPDLERIFENEQEVNLYKRLVSEGKTDQAQRYLDLAKKTSGLESRAGYEQSAGGRTLNTLGQVGRTIGAELFSAVTDTGTRVAETFDQAGSAFQRSLDRINPTMSEEQRQARTLADSIRFKGYQDFRRDASNIGNVIAGQDLNRAEETDREATNISQGRGTPGELFSAGLKSIDAAGFVPAAAVTSSVVRGTRLARPQRKTTQPSSQLEQAVTEVAPNSPAARSVEELRKAQIDSELTASGKYDTSAIQRATQKFKEAYNPTTELRKIDTARAKQLGLKRVDELPATERLELLFDKGTNSARQANEILKTPTSTGKSAYDLLQKYGEVQTGKTNRSRLKQLESEGAEFNRYTNNKFDLDYRARNGRPIQSDITDAELAQRVAQYEATNPDAITDLATKKALNDQAVDTIADAGVITRQEAEVIKNSSEFAVPLERLFSENLERVQIGGRSIGSLGRQSVVQAIEGNSSIPLSTSFSPLVKRIEKAVAQANRNTLAQKVLERAQQGIVKDSELLVTPGNKTIRKETAEQTKQINKEIAQLKKDIKSAPPAQKSALERQLDELETEKTINVGTRIEFGDTSTTGRQTISGFVDGEQFKLEVSPDLARVLQGLDVTAQNGLVRAMKDTTQVFRTAWTGFLNPLFTGISTIFYDLPMSAILPLINRPQAFLRTLGPRAITESLKSVNSNSAFQRQLAREGAQLIGGSQVIQDAALNAANIASRSGFFKRIGFLSKNPKQLLESADQFTGKLAGITRTRISKGYYDAAKARGLSDKDAIGEAVWAYNNILPNYARANQAIRSVDAFLPYVNAGIAGTRSLLTTMKSSPSRAVAVLAGVSAPLVGTVANNMATEEGRAFYQDMADSNRLDQLDRDIIIVLPGASKDPETGKWSGLIKIPIPPELRAMNKVARESTMNFLTGTGQSVESTSVALFDFMTGGVRTVESPLVDTVRIASGVNPQSDLLDSQPLVRGDMANLPKEQQVFESTSEAAKWLSEVTGRNISPIQADALLGQFGFVGSLAKGRDVGSQLENRFTKAYGQTTGSRYFQEYSLVDALRSQASREVTQQVKENDLDSAYQRAEEFNQEVEQAIDRYASTYGADSALLTELNNLKIDLNDASIRARRKQ